MAVHRTSPRPDPGENPEEGFALIMVVIFSILLFVLVADLVTSAQMAHATGRNDALLVRMENHMRLTLEEVGQQLKDDLSGGAGDEEGGVAGAMGAGEGEGANPLGAAGAGEGEGEGEEEPPSDSRNDAWYKPTPYSDGDLTTYALVEDENRKFNILSLASLDTEFAQTSKERLVRLLVSLRENTLFEISNSRAQTIADEIQDWLNGQNRNDIDRPRPKLKSDDQEHDQKTIPLHLDELLLLRDVDETIFYDLVIEGPPIQALPGLESVLTIYTSYRADPGDPEKNAARAAATGEAAGGATGNTGNTGNAGNTEGEGEGAAAPPPEGIGIKININTAPRQVLRCLFTTAEIPNSVIDAILKYRNEEVPEDEEGGEVDGESVEDYAGDIMEGMEPERKIFTTLDDLEEVPEFASLDPAVKEKFLALLSVESDVFSIYLACVYKKNEERKIFVMSRRRSVVIRLDGEEEPRLYPIIRLERCHGLRVQAVDFPDLEEERRELQQMEMDEFSVEERGWNPFFPEFYDRNRKQRQR